MIRSISNLAWEVFAKSRITFACIAGTFLVACLIATWRVPPVPGDIDGLADLFVFVMVASMMFVFGAFNYTHLDRRSGQTGFPNRLFTYPVATRLLVAVPMIGGVGTTVALYLAWTTLVIRPLGRDLPLGWPALVLAAAMAWYQATLWSLAAFRVARIIALCVIGTTLITAALVGSVDAEIGAWAARRTTVAAILALIAAAYAVALLAVKRQRHTGGHGAGLRFVVEKLLDLVPARRRPFRSPIAAQFWLESHRGSLLLPAGTLLVMLFVMLIGALMRHVPADTTVITLTIICLTPIVLGVLTGSVAGMPLVMSADSSMAPFLSTRPISDGDMVLAKLGAAALATTLAWAIVLALTPIWLMTWCDTSSVSRAWEHFTAMFPGRQRWIMLVLCALTVWVVTWRMTIINLHVAITGRPLFLTGYVMAGMWLATAIVAVVLNELGSAVRFGVAGTIFSAFITLAWILNLALVAKLALAASTAATALRHGSVSGRGAVTYGVAWLGATVVVALTLYLLASREPTLSRVMPWFALLAALWGLLLVPLARVALATQALARTRHG